MLIFIINYPYNAYNVVSSLIVLNTNGLFLYNPHYIQFKLIPTHVINIF